MKLKISVLVVLLMIAGNVSASKKDLLQTIVNAFKTESCKELYSVSNIIAETLSDNKVKAGSKDAFSNGDAVKGDEVNGKITVFASKMGELPRKWQAYPGPSCLRGTLFDWVSVNVKAIETNGKSYILSSYYLNSTLKAWDSKGKCAKKFKLTRGNTPSEMGIAQNADKSKTQIWSLDIEKHLEVFDFNSREKILNCDLVEILASFSSSKGLSLHFPCRDVDGKIIEGFELFTPFMVFDSEKINWLKEHSDDKKLGKIYSIILVPKTTLVILGFSNIQAPLICDYIKGELDFLLPSIIQEEEENLLIKDFKNFLTIKDNLRKSRKQPIALFPTKDGKLIQWLMNIENGTIETKQILPISDLNSIIKE